MYSLVQNLSLFIVILASNLSQHYVKCERVFDTTLAYPSFYKNRNAQLSPGRRQGIMPPDDAGGKADGAGEKGDPGDPSNRFSNKYEIANTTTHMRRRTAPYREEYMEEQCDYLAQYCLKSYQTGRLCARTIYFTYQTFKNYCMMDYVNCRERYEVWQVLHMGHCYEPKDITDHIHYAYTDDSFLDGDIIPDDQDWDMQVDG